MQRLLARVALLALPLAPIAVLAQSPRIERRQHGDTTIVRTTGSGVWGRPKDAVEIKRIGGETRSTTFGAVDATAATLDGGVVLFDSKGLDGTALRLFDREGKFIRTIGRHGSGPGEYPGSSVLLQVGPDGTIYLRATITYINHYAADGKFLNTITFPHGSGGPLDIHAGAAGTIYVRAGTPRSGPVPANLLPLVRYNGASRALDSVLPKPWVGGIVHSRFDPADTWNVFPGGQVVLSRTDRIAFLTRAPAKSSGMVLAELISPAPLLLPQERKEWQGLIDFRRTMPLARAEQQVRVTVPERKMALVGAPMLDADGRIWLLRSTTGVRVAPWVGAAYPGGSFKISWGEPPAFAVFQADGTFLGEVRFPLGAHAFAPSGMNVWAIVNGDDGAPYLVKYRISTSIDDR